MTDEAPVCLIPGEFRIEQQDVDKLLASDPQGACNSSYNNGCQIMSLKVAPPLEKALKESIVQQPASIQETLEILEKCDADVAEILAQHTVTPQSERIVNCSMSPGQHTAKHGNAKNS